MLLDKQDDDVSLGFYLRSVNCNLCDFVRATFTEIQWGLIVSSYSETNSVSISVSVSHLLPPPFLSLSDPLFLPLILFGGKHIAILRFICHIFGLRL